MNYYIGIDIGTSSTKSTLFDRFGNVIVSDSAEYDIISPYPSYAEENPLDWKNATLKTLKTLASHVNPNDVKGIGLSGQMHGLVMLDNDDNVLDNAIIWCDNRTTKEALEIKEFGEDKILEITGSKPMPAFTLAKLLWIRNNKNDIYKKISKIMLPKDYIRYVLTGEFKTEYSDASGMQMMDLKKENWSDEILSYFEIDKSILPKIVNSNDKTGTLKDDISEYTGLSSETFVVGGAGDQAASALGNGVVEAGDISITLGSSGVLFSVTDNLDIKKNGIQYFHHAIKGIYHTMGVTNGCGNSLKWYKENLCIEETKCASKNGISAYEYITRNMDKIEPGCNGLIYLPYLMGERTPNLAPNATGIFIGIRGNTTKDMMTRAIIEGISYSIRDCFKLIDIKPKNILISGGGARNPKWCQILSSMLGNKISRLESSESGTLGVAILAMVAANEYKNEKEASKNIIKIKDSFEPNKAEKDIYDRFYPIYERIYEQNKILFDLTMEELKK